MRADLAAALLSFAVFAFLAVMAWTGALIGVDNVKSRHLAWIVEELAVGNFGRAGSAALFIILGAASALLVLWIRANQA